MLAIGSIYKLRLTKKLSDNNLLIFEYENTIARLHKSNLSNNDELSNKMFDLFAVGEEVIAVVTKYNEEKKYYELSTKAFRNELDNTLSFTRCKKIVENGYKFYGDLSNDHLIQYRNILNRLRGDLASTGLTFLYELLQNAVDHPNNNFNNEVSIHFEVFNDFLLVKHNGALFTENNFKSITGILFGEQENETTIRRIGYKGIGFKSVFRHSNEVYIRSGNFSFSFTEENSKKLPWETMPVFQNEIDKIEEIPQFDFFNSPVAFAFKFPSQTAKESVINYLIQLSENPYLLIFLERLVNLKITIPSKELNFEKISHIENGNNMVRLCLNDTVNSDWYCFSETYEINKDDIEVITELNDVNNKSIPDHFRNFRNPKVNLFIPKVKISEMVNLFAYLPLSSTRYELDYIINSDFIPNLDRSNIIELKYNYKIAEFVADELLIASKKLSETQQYQIIKSLIPTFENEENDFKKSLKNRFINQINNFKIFPNYYNEELKCLDDIIIDDIELYRILPKNEYNELIGIKGSPLNKDLGLNSECEYLKTKTNQEKIYRVEGFKISIKTESFQKWLKIPKNNFKLIQHLSSNKELESLLKSEEIILSESIELFKASKLFVNIPPSLSFLNIETVNVELLNLLTESNLSLSLKTFDPKIFFNENIIDHQTEINNSLSTESNLLNFWRFIYDNWVLFESEANIKDSIKHFDILCKSEIELIKKPISSVHLSIEYNSTNEIESVINSLEISDAYFISEKYIDEQRTAEKWSKIFNKAEAIANLQAVMAKLLPKLPHIEPTKHIKIAKEIFKYWKANKEKPETQLTVDQINLIKQNLKIQRIDNEYYATKDCIIIISDHYNNNQRIASCLPILELPNQVSKIYAPNISQVGEWKNFLILIGCFELPDKQNVFDAKMNFYINSQEELQENHFEILKNLSDLYKTSNENGLHFDFKDVLPKIKLKASDENWHLPNNIHLSSIFCNTSDLDLQKDEEIEEIIYLSVEYKNEDYTRDFFKKLGVKSGFEYAVSEKIPYDKFPNQPLAHWLMYSKEFEKRRAFLLTKFKQSDINRYSSITNHIEFYCLALVVSKQYSSKFIDFIKKNKQSNLFQKSSLVNNGSSYGSADNNFLSFIKNNETISNQNNELEKPIDLYSFNFEAYISDKSLLPKTDFTKFNLSDEENLEEILGIQQLLKESHCIELLSRTENRITIEEIKQLQIVEILSNYTPTNEEKEKLFLLNSELEWKPINKLFISADEQFQIEPKQKLHEVFNNLVPNFGIPVLSEENLVLKTTPKSPDITDEIEMFFKNRAKFIAFKINQANYKVVADDIIEKLSSYKYIVVKSIEQVFKEEFNSEFSKPFDFYVEEGNIFYTGNWKFNAELIDWLLLFILEEKIQKSFFQSILTKSEPEIKEALKFEFGNIPWNIVDNTEPAEEPQTTNEPTFKQEVESFILSELENNEWRDYIPELKNILELSMSHPKEKQKLFNLIAKLKLAKDRNIHFEKNVQEFNQLSNETEKYFVHSARSSFAYIHTNEILRMKNEGYKMALDFGSKSKVKIYETAEEILKLNTNHLLLYQYDKPIEALISFCEANKEAHKHLLIVDRVNSNEKSKDILNLLMPPDDYQ